MKAFLFRIFKIKFGRQAAQAIGKVAKSPEAVEAVKGTLAAFGIPNTVVAEADRDLRLIDAQQAQYSATIQGNYAAIKALYEENGNLVIKRANLEDEAEKAAREADLWA